MTRIEELAKQAQERAEACQKAPSCKGMPQEEEEGPVPGKGHGATPEQWPDGACGCAAWGSR